MDKEGIDKAVILQGTLNGYQNYYTYQVVKSYPDRFIGAFAVDPFADRSMAIVHRYVEDLGFRAIKFEISQGGGLHGFHRSFRLDIDNRVSQIFHYLAGYPGFVVTVDYGASDQTSYQPEAIVNLARRYPQLDFVVCHLSFPDADHPDRLVNALDQFAPLTNISVDISAIQDILGEGRDDFAYHGVSGRSGLPRKSWVPSASSGAVTPRGRQPSTATTSWQPGWSIPISSPRLSWLT